MKKVLLGTTALMAAGVIAGASAQAAEPIKLSVGGFMTERVGVSDVDYNAANSMDGVEGWDVKQDAEIIFRGSTKLDNGITVGVEVQLEAASGGGASSNSDAQAFTNQIDETFMFVSGNFGRVNIGAENTAAYLMHYRHNSAGGTLSLDEGTITRWIPRPVGFTSGLNNSAPLVSNDQQSITYFTPRFEGIQGGISYVPSASRTQGTVLNPDNKALGGAIATGGSTNGLYDGVSLAVNFDRTFDQARVRASASWEKYQGTDNIAPSQDDLEQIALGGIVSFGGFSVGASWKEVKDDVDTTGTISGDQTVFAAGGGYRMGPTYFTINYLRGETKDTAALPGDDELVMWMGAVSHSIGPGISVHGAVMHADYDGEALAGVNDADGWAGVVGATARF